MAKTGKAPAFQFYVKDWLSDLHVRAMSPEERGIYIDLLAVLWNEGGSFACPSPEDLRNFSDTSRELLRNFSRTLSVDVRHFRRIFLKISDRFQYRDGRWYHAKLEAQRIEQEEFSSERSVTGKRGAEARWGKAEPSAADGKPDSPASAPASAPAKERTRLAYDGRFLTVFPWQFEELGKRLAGGRREGFALLEWFPRLEAELEKSAESLPADDRGRWHWLLGRLYRDARLPRPSLRQRDDEPVGRHVPDAEETAAYLQRRRERDAQIEQERAQGA
jgi:uncharacterized protein YdaU (DUF1376 family)